MESSPKNEVVIGNSSTEIRMRHGGICFFAYLERITAATYLGKLITLKNLNRGLHCINLHFSFIETMVGRAKATDVIPGEEKYCLS